MNYIGKKCCDFFDDFSLFVTRLLFEFISSQNIIYIKVLQWFFKENKWLSNKTNIYLNSFKDSAPYTSDDINWDEINKLFEKITNNGDILSFNYKPINSGTISIVFDGLLNNNPIIIKTKRKNVEQLFLNMKESLIKISNYIMFFTGKNYSKIIIKLCDALEKQCDFNQERENIKIFYDNCKSYRTMLPIYSIDKYCNNDIIVMSKCDGKNPTSLNSDNFELFQLTYMKTVTFLFFKKGIFHSDLHYGNIMYNEKNKKLTYIDLGIILVISPEVATSFQEMSYVALNEPSKFVEKLIENSEFVTKTEHDKQKIEKYCYENVFVTYFDLEDQLIEIGKFLNNLLAQPIEFIDIFPNVILMLISIIRISSEIKNKDEMKKIFSLIK
jgi:predicted unusual protein kinase regulating ubiquinone biosynthesis (AarF/ABC1/UbiB family)